MKFVNTRNPGDTATFQQAVLQGLAPGGGLWVPESLPVFDPRSPAFDET